MNVCAVVDVYVCVHIALALSLACVHCLCLGVV